MPNPNRPERITHKLLRQLFDYDAKRGRLVRIKKPGKTGKGNVGDYLPASRTGGKYPTYIANVQGHFVNYPRLVWLWHHKSTKGCKVRQRKDVRDADVTDFRIEGLELFGNPTPDFCHGTD